MTFASDDARRLHRAALQQLESLQRAGVKQLPKAGEDSRSSGLESGSVAQLAAVPARPAAALAAEPLAVEPGPIASPPRAASPIPIPVKDVNVSREPALAALEIAPQQRSVALDVIRLEVAACTCCAELAQTRKQTVFGVGNTSPRLCFFGEAPGADEDRLGEPFVGRAGQLLDKIIEACGFQRQDVYILNVLKCRPPNNRPPLPEESANCRHFWEGQLAVLKPEYLVCLGASAAQTMLQTTETISKLRGRFHKYQGIRVLATYHPSYLLRNPSAKREVWEDMKFLLRDMGLEVPNRQA